MSNTNEASSDSHLGGCACGAVRYRVSGRPMVGTVCHCTFCQRRLASAFAVVATFPESSVELIQGQTVQYEHRSDESGRRMTMSFCARCCTTVFHTGELRPGMRSIAAGTFDDPGWFRIDRHVWVRSKQDWVTIPEGVPVFQLGYVASLPPSSLP